jgi:hypothetical protein
MHGIDNFGLAYPIYVIWLSCSQRLLNYLAFQCFDNERVYLRLVKVIPETPVMRTKLCIYVFH